MTLILASTSPSRRRMLEAAGVAFEVDPPRVDEEAAKASLRAQGVKPRDQADALAELKALSVSNRRAGLVLGADQMLAIEGETLDKAPTLAEARRHLQMLRGRTHELMTAAVIARDGAVIWRHVETPKLKMRAFSDAFLDAYLACSHPESTQVPAADDLMRKPFATYCNVHLVSDSTGETLAGVMRATCAQFDYILPIEHSYFLVRSARQLDKVLKEIEAAPGIVMFTLSNMDHRSMLETRCKELGQPCVPVLDPVLDTMSRYLGQEMNHRVGAARVLNAEYFQRIDALDFAMYHDDGQQIVDLKTADVILVGVSRTSKTPTCVYLAHRGVKAANVPYVPNVKLPPELFADVRPLVVGLTISPDRLIHIRKNRLAAMKETRAGNYTEEDTVRKEVMNAQKLFEKEGWPTVDVSRRSIEETAAAVLNLLSEHRGE